MSMQYLFGDWGTTHLRLYLVEQDETARPPSSNFRVIAMREGTGIGSLQCPPLAELTHVVEQLIGSAQPMDIVLCGMASSRNGVRELPYVRCPADLAGWAEGAVTLEQGALKIMLATGMQCGNDADGFDVMRGEEAQIFGAMHIEPALHQGAQYFLLPGTHSKWVEVRDGAVMQVRTALTGEVYALLRQHSTLLKATPVCGSDEQFDQGFAAGVAHSMHTQDGLLTALFKTRTAQLLQGRSGDWASGFLSGVLIGYEVTTLINSVTPSGNVTLIGQTRLTALYQRVFAARGTVARILDGAACVVAGLSQLRDQWTRLSSRSR